MVKTSGMEQWIIRSQASRTEEGSQTVRVRVATVCYIHTARLKRQSGPRETGAEWRNLREEMLAVESHSG